MRAQLMKVGLHVLNPEYVASADWEGGTLYAHLAGGRFVSFRGQEAQLVWRAISDPAQDLKASPSSLRTG